MILKLLKTFGHSTMTFGTDAYFTKSQTNFENPEKYVELKYSTSLKNKKHCDQINANLPLSKKGLIKAFGLPKSYVHVENWPSLETLYYRQALFNIPCQVEFHLFEDQVFFYRYVFTNSTAVQREQLLRAISEKYLKNISFKPGKDIITDGSTYLNIEAKFNVHLNYFSPLHAPILDRFTEDIRKREQSKSRRNPGQQLVYQGF